VGVPSARAWRTRRDCEGKKTLRVEGKMMKPYYEHAGITIYHGDCMEILPQLKPVDLVLTDPPYLINLSGGNKGCFSGRKYVINTKGFTDGGVDYSFLNGFKNFFVFCSIKQLPELLSISFLHGNTKLLTWNKPNPIPTICNTYLSDVEYIVHCWQKGRLFGDYKTKSTYHIYPCGQTLTKHPNEKPLSIINRFVLLGSLEKEIILDPFMGSGTTLRAAKDLGRNAIGIEIEEKYCEIAAQRLSQETLPL
jgi:site-specific DNA-methyltransferase (adenine-specific)